MNANLDYVLRRLNEAIKGLNVNKPQEVSVAYHVQDPEDLNDILDASSILKDKKVIEEYGEYSSGQEKIETSFSERNGHPYDEVYFYKFKYQLKPKVLMEYLVETSRLPKYSLEFDEVRSKVILNKKYILATPDYDGPNYSFFSYTINKSRQIIRKENFTKELVGELNVEKLKEKTIRSILEQVLKNNELIKVFFPHVSKDSTYFRNDVTTKDLVGQKINEKKIGIFLKTDERVKYLKSFKE